MTNSNSGGYRNLIVYQQAVIIFNLNADFTRRFLNAKTDARTIDQMHQAARSGKQNIVEASLERSLKLNIKLTSVARASLGELLEDYHDFLRLRKLKIWDKDDPRLAPIRQMRIDPNKTNLPNWSNWTNSPERFTNLMVTLISKENYLLDQMIRSLEQKFIQEGGYTENLAKKRRDYRGY